MMWELTDPALCSVWLEGDRMKGQLEAIKTARNTLYDVLPSGEIDAFDLVKVIKKHIDELDAALEGSD